MHLVDYGIPEVPAVGELAELLPEVDGLEPFGRDPDEEVLAFAEGVKDDVLVRAVHLALDAPDAVDAELVRVELLVLD